MLFLFGFVLPISTTVMARCPCIDSGQLKTRLAGSKNEVLVDRRTHEEFLQAHIPRTIGIPAFLMKAKIDKRPKDKSTPIIFYRRDGLYLKQDGGGTSR